MGEGGGPPFCPSCGERLFTSALKKREPSDLKPTPEVVEGSFEEPSAELGRPEFEEAASTALGRPKPTVAEFLRRVADDLDAHRATTVGTDFVFERMRVMGPGYDLIVGRYDRDRDHPHRAGRHRQSRR